MLLESDTVIVNQGQKPGDSASDGIIAPFPLQLGFGFGGEGVEVVAVVVYGDLRHGWCVR